MASSTILKRFLTTRLNQSGVVESLKVMTKFSSNLVAKYEGFHVLASPNLYGNLIANTDRGIAAVGNGVMPGGTMAAISPLSGIHQRTWKSMDNPTSKTTTTTTTSSNPDIGRLDPSIAGYSQEDLKSTDKLFELFESWMAKHNKIYDSDEEKLRRFEVFKDDVKYIEETNKVITGYCLGLNDFSDMTMEELTKALCMRCEA
ncbi:hypothetical protein PIB30_028734 [Stylosanthes scabra]|uniref:Cathepsin propeptide inhibitor domain-containing protein n=1 Tax=Stylosanthes scabra TaxID=79078 RepID=A0ABU6WE43_9FABA|nr:hypothetical protein [Stylosanthes scabra]